MCSQRLRTCKFYITVLELASYSYNNFLVKERLACFSTLDTSALQLAIDHDDGGITFDKHGPFPSGGSSSSGASSYLGNRTKVLWIPYPDIK